MVQTKCCTLLYIYFNQQVSSNVSHVTKTIFCNMKGRFDSDSLAYMLLSSWPMIMMTNCHCRCMNVRLDRLHRAYANFHLSRVVHWVPCRAAEHKGYNWGMQVDWFLQPEMLCSATPSVTSSGICHRNKVNSNAWPYRGPSRKIVPLHCITLHYTTLHYITLHYITLHYITLHYITLHYITLHYITLHYITLLDQARIYNHEARI